MSDGEVIVSLGIAAVILYAVYAYFKNRKPKPRPPSGGGGGGGNDGPNPPTEIQ